MEMAKFKSFWKESEGAEAIFKRFPYHFSHELEPQALKRAKGWQEKVRDFISGVIANMYRSIRRRKVAVFGCLRAFCLVFAMF